MTLKALKSKLTMVKLPMMVTMMTMNKLCLMIKIMEQQFKLSSKVTLIKLLIRMKSLVWFLVALQDIRFP